MIISISLLFRLIVIQSIVILYPLIKERRLKILRIVILLGSFIIFNRSNLFILYLSFELRLLPILLIILGWGYNQERLIASTLLLIYTVVARIPFIFFVIWSDYYFNSWLIFLPFFVKLPLIGLHLWLPKAHVESPTLGRLLLAGLLLKLGRYGIYKIIELSGYNIRLLISVLLLGRVLIFLLTATQRDGKRLIAYRRVGHMNLGVVLLLSYLSLSEGGYILINYLHMIIRGIMFYFIGILFYYGGRRIIYFLKRWSSIYLLIIAIFILSSNAGTPPIASFIREFIHLRYIFLSSPIYLLPLWVYGLLGGYFSIYFFRSSLFSPNIKNYPSFSLSSFLVISYITYSLIYLFLFLYFY